MMADRHVRSQAPEVCGAKEAKLRQHHVNVGRVTKGPLAERRIVGHA
jgi:hypothetical protein